MWEQIDHPLSIKTIDFDQICLMVIIDISSGIKLNDMESMTVSEILRRRGWREGEIVS